MCGDLDSSTPRVGVALGGNLGGKGGGGEALGCLWGLSDFFGLGGKGGAATADDKDTHWLGFGGVYICEGVVGSMTISLTFPSRSGGETDKVADIIIGVLGPDNGEDL